MSPWMIACGVFVAMAMLDYVWALYTLAITQRRVIKASVLSMVIAGLAGTVAISYVNDPLMLLPTLAGAFVGTYVAVKTS